MYVGDVDASERGMWLIDQLRQRGRVDVAEAAAEFGTAEMTIRRDLDTLVQQGVARRVRGGAVSLLMRGEELPFAMREMSAAAAKQRIGTAAAGLIADGEAVGLDGGTTVLETARALRGRRLTVLPVSLHAAMALAESSPVRLLMPGGEVRPGELSLVGPATLATIATLRLDTVVLGCCGISPEGQVTTHDLGDAAVKQALIGCARRTVLVLDGSKFTHSAMAVVCDATSLDVVVTDDTAPAETIASLETAGTVVHRV
jgi:DeoR/GlpR family transcriptional regulator of sugar metabolism